MRRKKGFTLIELIAVIAILAVITVIAIPNVIRYRDESIRVSIKQDALIVYKIAIENSETGLLKINTGKSSPVRVATILPNMKNGRFIDNEMEVGQVLGWWTTLNQLKLVINMKVSEIPIKNGALDVSKLA